MSKVAMWVRLPLKPGMRDQAVAALEAQIAAVKANEPGTELYIMMESESDPDAIFMYEVYADTAAQAAHGTTDSMKALGAAMRDFVAGRPEVGLFTPISGKGL